MGSPSEHYAEAERLIAEIVVASTYDDTRRRLALAQVHATLATARDAWIGLRRLEKAEDD